MPEYVFDEPCILRQCQAANDESLDFTMQDEQGRRRCRRLCRVFEPEFLFHGQIL